MLWPEGWHRGERSIAELPLGVAWQQNASSPPELCSGGLLQTCLSVP